jgi:hypothetical protein
MVVELFAGSHPASRLPRLAAFRAQLSNFRMVANLTAEVQEHLVARHGFTPGLQKGAQCGLRAEDCCHLSGEEARVGLAAVDDSIVNFVVDRLQAADGSRACEAVVIFGGPPCEVHSDARALVATEEDIAASLATVEAYLKIVQRIKQAAEQLQDGPLVSFVMENPNGDKNNSLHR